LKKIVLFLLLTVFAIPSAFAEVYIDNDRKYLGDDGTIHIVGEIINESNQPITKLMLSQFFILIVIVSIRQALKI